MLPLTFKKQLLEFWDGIKCEDTKSYEGTKIIGFFLTTYLRLGFLHIVKLKGYRSQHRLSMPVELTFQVVITEILKSEKD